MSYTKRKRGHGRQTGGGGDGGGEEEELVHIVWDMENSNVPVRCDISDVFENIKKVIRGQAAFHIVGDTGVLKEDVLKTISVVQPDTSVKIARSGVADFGDKEMIAKIYSLAADERYICNHFVFITGDVDFCTTLSALRQRNIRVGVACLPDVSSPILKWAANYALNWTKLAYGEEEYFVRPRSQLQILVRDCNKKSIHIYWDLDTCSIPERIGSSVEFLSKLTESFQNLLRKNGYWGRFKIWAYGSSSTANQQFLQANFMSFQPIARGKVPWKINAADMIQVDASAKMLNCRNGVFFFITNEDVRFIVQSLQSQEHDVVVMRSPLDFL